jgi:hypothetical protein
MLLDKLWLRIKGEFLLLKEDMASGDDLREKAETFLDKLEGLLGAPESRENRESRVEDALKKMEEAREKSETELRRDRTQGAASPTLAELEKAWEELSRLRQEKKQGQTDEAPPPPNPRKLG